MSVTYIQTETCALCIQKVVLRHSVQVSASLLLRTFARSTALLDKLTVVQLFKKFPTFYGIRRFITALKKKVHHWSL